MMQNLLFAAAAVLTLLTQESVSQCTDEAVKACYDAFVGTAGTVKDKQGIPILFKTAAVESDFTNLCSAKDNFQTCISSFQSVCLDEVKYTLQGFYDAANYMCTTKQSSDYTTNVPCIGSPSNLGQSAMCLDVMTKSLTPDNWCQKLNDYLGCMTKGANINCNQAAAADYQHEIMAKLYQAKATAMYNCTLSNREYYCRRTAVSVCFMYFTQVAGLSRDYLDVPLPFVTDVSDASVDKICTSRGGLKNCVSYDQPCSGVDLGVQKTLEGVQGMFDYICDNKDEYKASSKCLAEAGNAAETDKCTRAVNDGLTGSNYCSKVDTYYECLKTGATKTCSATEVDYQDQIYKKFLEPQSERYTCGASGNIASLTMLFGAFIVFHQLLN